MKMNKKQAREYMEHIQSLTEKSLSEELDKIIKSTDEYKDNKIMTIYIDVDSRDTYIQDMKLRIHLFLMNESIKEQEDK